MYVHRADPIRVNSPFLCPKEFFWFSRFGYTSHVISYFYTLAYGLWLSQLPWMTEKFNSQRFLGYLLFPIISSLAKIVDFPHRCGRSLTPPGRRQFLFGYPRSYSSYLSFRNPLQKLSFLLPNNSSLRLAFSLGSVCWHALSSIHPFKEAKHSPQFSSAELYGPSRVSSYDLGWSSKTGQQRL